MPKYGKNIQLIYGDGSIKKNGIYDIFNHICEQYFSGTDDNVSDYISEGLMRSLIHSSSIVLKNPADSELLYHQKFESIQQFKAELIDYLNYYNNCRIKAKLKGLPPAIHRQQALLAA